MPSNATLPITIIAHVEGSGTGPTAIPLARVPVARAGMKLAVIKVPVVALYSLTGTVEIALVRDTKRSLPDKARPP